jgi:hypothetical protein
MTSFRAPLNVLAAALVAGAGLWGCSTDRPRQAVSGGSGGESSGGTGGSGQPESGGSGGTASGGTGAEPVSGGSGGTASAGGSGGTAPVAGQGGAPDAAAAGQSGDGSASGGVSGGDGGFGITSPDGSASVLACWSDPRVIAICHQLENACENCPPGGAPNKNPKAQPCFDLVEKAYKGMASDADCVAFAVENKCFVDNAKTTGNVCGSLNCYAPGCSNKARCLDRQQWGDSSMCAPFMATCACK